MIGSQSPLVSTHLSVQCEFQEGGLKDFCSTKKNQEVREDCFSTKSLALGVFSIKRCRERKGGRPFPIILFECSFPSLRPATSDENMEDEAADSLSWNIALAPTGDSGSQFHTKNDPNKPLQRQNYVERKGAVDVRCSCADVVHGFLSPDSDILCTLIVLDFRFDSRKRARRIASVHIDLRFSSLDPNSPYQPEVRAISPDGNFTVAPTTQTESSTLSGNLGISATPGPAPTLSAGISIDKSITRDMTYAATVVGAKSLRGRNFGQPNSASWTLLENPATETGVPVAMRAAVLLEREDEELFQCSVTIKARADWRTTLESVFGSTPPDDPVLFDPTIESKRTHYDEMNLAEAFKQLSTVPNVTFRKGLPEQR
ncbi:Putative protein of unknown function [Podospora comata]|uniref:LDB19 N-terminal domain-containing protein n=1 Tax=Podospora comata TaxID=48703 RepID=A0ABY6S918_PODCO|nr:Putative protein of unknown function [Podospora comata]